MYIVEPDADKPGKNIIKLLDPDNKEMFAYQC